MSFDVEQLKADVGNHLQARHLGWCDKPFPLYVVAGLVGPMVVHMTIQRHLWLLWTENPLICGANEATNFDEAIRQFLYLVSPDCVPFGSEGRSNWDDANPDLSIELCKQGIAEYMEAQFCNGTGYVYRPSKSVEAVKESTEDAEQSEDLFEQVQAILDPLKGGHFAAHYLRLFHREFGYDRETVFNMPYPQLHMLEWELIFESQAGREGAKMYPKDTYQNAYLESLNNG